MDISEVSFEYLHSKEVKGKIGEIIFVVATDSNHGREAAWAVKQFGKNTKRYLLGLC